MAADPVPATQARASREPGSTATPPATGSPSRALRIGFGVAAAILVLMAARLPIWEARLSAPQYPAGLSLSAGGFGVRGDIREVNELNHYVGMEAFSAADAPEISWWIPVIVLALLAVVVATVLPRRHPLARLARIGLWLVPIGALADVQWRLHQYGQGVSDDAPIRLEPFTPLVIGPTHVLNFTTWAFPGGAVWCLLGAAFLISFGPGLAVWACERWETRPIYVDDGIEEP